MLDEYSTNPTNDYQIDPAFNKDLVFAYQAHPEIDISKLTNLNKNWLSDFENIIFQADPSMQKEKIFDRHVGEKSTYRTKDHLIKQLQLIYHRLKGNLDSTLGKLSLDEDKALIIKLTEEIKSCSEGFHNRVNIIVGLFYKPRNLAELLCVVRKEIVEEVASELAKEIHAWNRVSFIAACDGLGVNINFPKDRYSGDLTDLAIRTALQKAFHQKFTPFHLPSLLIRAFIKFIPELETEKKNKNGLNQEMQEKITTLIQHFLPEFINEMSGDPNYWLNYFEVFQNEKNLLDIIVVNINFEKLYQSFFNALSSHKYFKSEPRAKTLIDSAYQNLLIKNKHNNIPNKLIYKLFKEEKYSDLLEQLKKLNIQFPSYYQEISKLEIFSKNCQAFLNYLIKELNIKKLYLPGIVLGFQLIINLDLCRKNLLIENVADTLLLKDQSDFNLLMFAAQRKPDLVKDILDFIKNNKKIINQELVKNIFLIKNKDNLNAIMIAAIHHPKLLKTMLDFVGENIQNFGNNLESIFLEEHSNYNLLILAKSKEAIHAIVLFFNKNIVYSYFTKKIFFKLFMQQQKNTDTALNLTVHNHPDYLNNILISIIEYLKRDGEILNSIGACAILMLAAEKNADATLFILDFISKNIQKFDRSSLEKIFSEKNKDGWTILMLAAFYQAKALKFILTFIDEHPNLFHEEDLSKLFLEKNNLEYNALMLAAHNQSAAVKTILDFIAQRSRIFPVSIIKSLFLEETEGSISTLMIAVKHQPEALKIILDFIQQNQFFIFPLNDFLTKFLTAQNQFGVNALMLAATCKPKAVEQLLAFLSNKIEHLDINTLEQFIFKDIRDIEANNEVFFGGRWGFRKTVMSVTSQLKDPTAINALLRFVDKHIELLGMKIFTKLLTEQDKDENYIFNPACSRNPYTMKKTLDFIATSPHSEALKLTPHLLTEFIFGQLARWSIKTQEDKNLFCKITSNCSNLLLNHFNIDRFGQHFDNLEKVSKKLLPYLLVELKLKKTKVQNEYFFFRWFSPAEQELQIGQRLLHILNSAFPGKWVAIKGLQEEYPKLLKSKSALSALYEAFITIEKRKAEKMQEFHHENNPTYFQQQLMSPSL